MTKKKKAKSTEQKTYYVDPVNGDDTNNGLMAMMALKTLDVAYEKCEHGDKVYIIVSDPSYLK